MADLPSLPDLLAPLQGTPLAGRGAALAGGVLLLGWGARLYQIAVVLPGVLAGVWIGEEAREAFRLSALPAALGTVALALVGAALCQFAEGFAVRLSGAALAAGVAVAGWHVFQGPPMPAWAPLVGAAAGFLLVPPLYRALLRPLTAALGALCVAWATRVAPSPELVLGLTVVGTAAQYALDRGPRPATRAKAPKVKKAEAA